jgi:hypothetical protein
MEISVMMRVLDAFVHEALNLILIAVAYQVMREILFVVAPCVAALYGVHRLTRRLRS